MTIKDGENRVKKDLTTPDIEIPANVSEYIEERVQQVEKADPDEKQENSKRSFCAQNLKRLQIYDLGTTNTKSKAGFVCWS